MDVRYVSINTGLKEELLLEDATAPTTFSFSLAGTPGTTFASTPDGGVEARDPSGGPRFTIPPPNVSDSSGGTAGFSTTAVAYALSGPSAAPTLTVKLNSQWLADPARVFPVVVDPSTLGVDAAQATWINSAAPSTSYAGSATLKVGATASAQYHTLVKYDLSTLPRNAELISTGVQGAVVSNSAPGSTPLLARALNQPWTTAATWNSRNATRHWTSAGGTTVSPTFSSDPVTSGTQDFEVLTTSTVRGWVDNPASNHGLRMSTSSTANTALELAQAPYLNVNYYLRSGDGAFYTYQDFALTDRTALKVNLASGNLQVRNNDVRIAGIGEDLALNRFWDSLGTSRIFSSPIPGQWTQSPGKDLRLLEYGDGVLLLGPANLQEWFARSPTGVYTSPPGVNGDLASAGAGFPEGALALTYRSSQERLIFGDYGLLTDTRDRNNNATTFKYSTPLSASSSLTSVTDTRGRTVNFSYRPDGLLSSMTDSIGRTWSYGYDSTGEYLTSYTDPNSKTTSYGYDSAGLLSQIVDPRGSVTNLRYDGTGRVTRIQRVTGTDSSGGDVGPTTTFAYTDTPVSYTDSTGSSSSYYGKTLVVDPNGHQNTHYYDSSSRVTRSTDARGFSESRSFTKNSDVATTTDAVGAGNTTTTVYDSDNRAVKTVAPTGAATTLTYSEPPGSVQDPVQHWQPKSSTDAEGRKVGYTYDGSGNLVRTQDAAGGSAVTQGVYGNAGVAACGGRPGQTGQVCTTTDGRGNTTHYTYNALGEAVTVTPPSPLGSTQYTYDGASRVASMQDGKGQVTRYQYDNLDRLAFARFGGALTCTASDISSGRCVRYSSDDAGNQTSQIDQTGTTTYEYDRLNREVSRTLPSTGRTTLTYDAAGNKTSATDAGGTTSYRYNEADQLVALAEPGGECTATTGVRCTRFTVDANGERIGTNYPTAGGTVVSATPDASGRVARVQVVSGGLTPVDVSYTYSRPSGTTRVDGELLRSQVDHTATGGAGRVTEYDYDTLGRLATAVERDAAAAMTAAWRYAYDDAGNRTSATLSAQGAVGSADTAFAYNPANQIVSRDGIAAGFSYDANGNEVEALGALARTAAHWDNKNLLVSTTGAGATVPFSYMGASPDVRLAAGATNYRNTALGLTAETSSGATTSFVRDPDGALVAMRVGGRSYYYLHDGLGSVVGLVDDQGQEVNQYNYDPYGQSRSKLETVANPFQYRGGQLDSTTGLYKLGIRYYDPTLGRFTQVDPTGADPHYIYASNDPINGSDPTGAWTRKCGYFSCTWYFNRNETQSIGNGASIAGITIGLAGGPITAAILGISGQLMVIYGRSGICLKIKVGLTAYKLRQTGWYRC